MHDLRNDEDIYSSWENIEKDIETSAKENICLRELKQHELWIEKNVYIF